MTTTEASPPPINRRSLEQFKSKVNTAIYRPKWCFRGPTGLNGRAARCHDRGRPALLGEKPMSIYEQVLTFIHRPEPEAFERLALDVFRHQFETIAAYRRYCEGRGIEPGAVGALTRFRRSAMSRSSTLSLRLRAHRDCLMRPFFSPAGPRRGERGADGILWRGPRFIARRRSLICGRCCSPTLGEWRCSRCIRRRTRCRSRRCRR